MFLYSIAKESVEPCHPGDLDHQEWMQQLQSGSMRILPGWCTASRLSPCNRSLGRERATNQGNFRGIFHASSEFVKISNGYGQVCNITGWKEDRPLMWYHHKMLLLYEIHLIMPSAYQQLCPFSGSGSPSPIETKKHTFDRIPFYIRSHTAHDVFYVIPSSYLHVINSYLSNGMRVKS